MFGRVKLALLSLPLLVMSAACGHTPCTTDADCEAGFVCNAQACTKNTAPPDRPEECGDRCSIGADRCTYTALDSAFERCDLVDRCSKWTVLEACGADSVCTNDDGCAAYLSEGTACSEAGRCEIGLRCESPAFAGGSSDATCMRECNGAGCSEDETCAYDVCIPTALCTCTPGQVRCAGAQAPEYCTFIDTSCGRWAALDACTGTNACEVGECVGTIPIGGTCSAENNCMRGAICLDDSSTCSPTCAASAECTNGEHCRLTAGSGGHGICSGSNAPVVEATCTIGLGRLVVMGEWDNVGNESTFAPDPYVQISGGLFNFITSEATDTASIDISLTTPQMSIQSLFAATLSIWDSDAPFSPADEIGAWRVSQQFDWNEAMTSRALTLMNDAATLEITVDCTLP